MVPRFFFGGRQWGRRRALDLAASELAELQQRCEMAAAEATATAKERHMGVASGGWCAPTEALHGLLDLPPVSSQHGEIDYPMRPAPDKSWLKMGSSHEALKTVPRWQ